MPKSKMSKSRGYGSPGGSGITGDPYEYLDRLKFPAIQLPEEIDKEKFLRILKDYEEPKREVPTKEEFLKILKIQQGQVKRMYNVRTMKEKLTNALKYFETVEERWWIDQQMKLLDFKDDRDLRDNKKYFERWVKQVYLPTVKKVAEKLKEPILSQFVDAAFEYMEKLEPKPRSDATNNIISRIRYLVLSRRYEEYYSLSAELGIFRSREKPVKKETPRKGEKLENICPCAELCKEAYNGCEPNSQRCLQVLEDNNFLLP